jgi:phage/plasmid-associated DNA primase
MFNDGEKRCIECEHYKIEKDNIYNFYRYFCKGERTEARPVAFACKNFVEKKTNGN